MTSARTVRQHAVADCRQAGFEGRAAPAASFHCGRAGPAASFHCGRSGPVGVKSATHAVRPVGDPFAVAFV